MWFWLFSRLAEHTERWTQHSAHTHYNITTSYIGYRLLGDDDDEQHALAFNARTHSIHTCGCECGSGYAVHSTTQLRVHTFSQCFRLTLLCKKKNRRRVSIQFSCTRTLPFLVWMLISWILFFQFYSVFFRFLFFNNKFYIGSLGLVVVVGFSLDFVFYIISVVHLAAATPRSPCTVHECIDNFVLF